MRHVRTHHNGSAYITTITITSMHPQWAKLRIATGGYPGCTVCKEPVLVYRRWHPGPAEAELETGVSVVQVTSRRCCQVASLGHTCT
jgi:hypothetical protein